MLRTRHEPRTALAKRADVEAISTGPPAKSVENLGTQDPQGGSTHRHFEALAGRPFGEDFTVTILIEPCGKEQLHKFQLTNKGMSHKEVKDDIVALIERRCDPATNGLVPIGSGNQEKMMSQTTPWSTASGAVQMASGGWTRRLGRTHMALVVGKQAIRRRLRSRCRGGDLCKSGGKKGQKQEG